MSNSGAQTVKRVILTGSIAAVTATGAWYGAGLKARQEFKQERKIINQASSAETLQRLETVRSRLLEQRSQLQDKVDTFNAKIAASAGAATNNSTDPAS